MSNYATLKDVAKRAGTTAATVSYVLNDSKERYISADMRDRVLRAAKELNYVKSNVASSLKGQKTKMIAVLVPQILNCFFTRMLLAIEEVADEHGYLLSIYDTLDNAKREKEIIKRMSQQRMDGYIIIPTKEGAQNTAQLRELGIPMVVVDRPLEGEMDYPWVTTDNYQCGYKGTEYLVQKGHERIGYINWDSQIPDLESRETGYWNALRAYGLDVQKSICLKGGLSQECGYELTKKLFEEKPGLTAVFYGYHIQAQGGIRYLLDRGMKIGTDISVLIIGSPEWTTAGKNNFTHINQYEYSLGQSAAKILFDVIDAKEPMGKKIMIQDCSIHEGNSVVQIKNGG